MEVFRERGYECASIPELTERLGICRQSLYATFGDKRGLYRRALERYGERELDQKLAVLEGPGSPLDNVRTVLRGFADLAGRCPAEGCLTAKVIVGHQAEDRDLAALADAQVTRLEQGFAAALGRAAAAGELRDGVSPDRWARFLVTACYGVGVMSRLATSGPRVADSVGVMLDLLEREIARPGC